jgi:hypothetical protein
MLTFAFAFSPSGAANLSHGNLPSPSSAPLQVRTAGTEVPWLSCIAEITIPAMTGSDRVELVEAGGIELKWGNGKVQVIDSPSAFVLLVLSVLSVFAQSCTVDPPSVLWLRRYLGWMVKTPK